MPAPNDVPVVRLVRDRRRGQPCALDLLDPGTASAVLADLISDQHQLAPEPARLVAAALGGATGLLDELPWLDMRSGDPDHVARTILTLPHVTAVARDMAQRGGRQLLELGRVLCICEPPEMSLTSEWPRIARLLSDSDLGPSDLAIALAQFPGLFTQPEDRPGTIAPAGPLARALLLGEVAVSREEHRQMLDALRVIARRAAPDPPGATSRRQLPEQALRAGALPTLVADPTAVLASEPDALAHAIERSAEALADPVARATLLSTQHLVEAEDAASHLELAMRRRGLQEAAGAVAAAPAFRRWRPLWARSRPASPHRVIIERSVGALCTDATHDRGALVAFAGYADGSAWRVSTRGGAQRIATHVGELRAVACAHAGQRLVVGYGTSSRHVLVVDGRSSKRLWTDVTSHSQPLSAMAAGVVDGDVRLFSAGVAGEVYEHDALAGPPSARLVTTEASEVRGLAVCDDNGRALLGTSCVDGTVAVFDLATDRELWRRQLGRGVLNGIAFLHDDGLTVAVASSSGAVLKLRVGDDEGDPVTLATHRSGSKAHEPVSANAIRALSEGLVSAGSDGKVFIYSRQRIGAEAEWSHHPLVGHVAPVWSVAAAREDDRQYIVSTAADGATRLWRPVDRQSAAVGTSPASPIEGVDAVALVRDTEDVPVLFSGEASGAVRCARLAPGEEDAAGEPLARHNDRVSAVAAIMTAADSGMVASGSVDGALRITLFGATTASRVLGIVHGGVGCLAILDHDEAPLLVSGGADGSCATWDLSRMAMIVTHGVCDFGAVTALSAAPRGRGDLFVAGGQDGTLTLFSPKLEPAGALHLDSAVTAICAVPGSSGDLAVSLDDGRLAVVGTARNGGGLKLRFAIQLFHNEIMDIAATSIAGQPWIIACGLDRKLRIVDPSSGVTAMEISTDGYGRGVAADRRVIAVGSSLGATAIEIAPDAIQA